MLELILRWRCRDRVFFRLGEGAAGGFPGSARWEQPGESPLAGVVPFSAFLPCSASFAPVRISAALHPSSTVNVLAGLYYSEQSHFH